MTRDGGKVSKMFKNIWKKPSFEILIRENNCPNSKPFTLESPSIPRKSKTTDRNLKNRTGRPQRFQSNGKIIASDTTKVTSESTFVRNGYQKLTCYQKLSVVDYTKTLNRLVIVGYNQLPLSSLVLIKLTLQVGMGNASELAIMISWVKSARKSKPSQSCDVFPWFIQIICSNHLTGIDELKGLYSWTWAKASWLKAIQS